MSKENENPHEGQDLLETMSELYNAGEDEPVVDEVVEEVEQAEDPEVTEEVAEVAEQPEQVEEVEEVELEPLNPNDLWEPQIKEKFHELPRDIQEFLLNTTTNWQTGYNKKFEELAGERRQLEPIQQTFQDPILSGYLNQQGWQPHQAVQVLGQHIRNILTDPKAGYQTLMSSLGHDPASIFSQEDEQWVDPAVAQANQRIEQLERERQQELQTRQSEMQEKAYREVVEFQNQKNEQGNLVYPRFQELREPMMGISNGLPHLSLEQVYRMAEAQNPAQTQDPVSTKAASPQQVQRAKAAKKTVKSKTSTKPKATQKMSLDDELKMAYRAGAGV